MAEYRKKSRTRKQTPIRNASGYHYLLYLPPDYDMQNTWPLILFLHGAGERGDDLERVKKLGIARVIEDTDYFPFIGVSPQCPRGRYWYPPLLKSLLKNVFANYNVDMRRIYLTGVSMGGYGTWRLAAEMPETFAAIAPICGGGEPSTAPLLKDIPAWVFHGAKDDVVPISESRKMVEALESCGGNVRFTVYPDAGHDSWTETYENPKLFKWFQSHRKGGQKKGNA